MSPSPARGFAQIFKIEYKIDGFILLKIDKMSPKRTFWAKPPEGEGEYAMSACRRRKSADGSRRC
jgi:hypothetical protein